MLKKITNWFLLRFHSIMFAISVALYNTENDILKADPNDLGESNKHVQRMRHRNQTLEKFYAGQTDEKYVQDYYEVLKKSDAFMRNATPFKIAVAADKNAMTYGKEDKYGRVYEHYGFFDPKHKNYGKTVADAEKEEILKRKTNDDDYQLLYIFNNSPIEIGLLNLPDEADGDNISFTVDDLINQAKNFEFPMKIYRANNEVVNKIEKITEYFHVKKIGFDFVLLEFFVPLKFKTNKFDDESDVMKELINIDQVFFTSKYGEIIGFKVNEYVKRITLNDTYEVFKFNGNIMEIVK